MTAVIMAGGTGTRLRSVVSDIPKPMVPVCGKPVLEYQILNLKNHGIIDIILIIGYLGHVIKEYFENGGNFGVNISYVEEQIPLGTAGALYFIKDKVCDNFFFLFGDLMLDIDWQRMLDFHKKKGCKITLFAHPNSHPWDSDLVLMDTKCKVMGLREKNETRDGYFKNCVNAGVYVLSPDVLDDVNTPEKKDFEKEIVPNAIINSEVYAYCSSEYVKDIGTPDRLQSVSEDLASGLISSKNHRYPQKCIFLDRDGTINRLDGFLNDIDHFKLIDSVSQAIHLINRSSHLCIVVTNQPVIARGECTFEQLQDIHNKMEVLLGDEGAYVDGIFFCPHHPDSGYPGEVKELKFSCDCRKPNIGMLTAASDQYNIDFHCSWFIGDSTVDIQTGKNAGMHTALVLTGECGRDGKYNCDADITKVSLLEAVKYILSLD